jgi:hypothetical protein
MSKQTKQFLKRIERRGWSWEYRRSGHLKLHGPNGEMVFCASTPSDHRAWRNVETNMRRAREQAHRSR